MKKILVGGVMFIGTITFGQKGGKTMDQAVEMACQCGEAVKKKIDKRMANGKPVNFNVSQAAHDCAQDALNEYGAMMLEEIDAVPLYGEGIEKQDHLDKVYNNRVSTECGTLIELLHYQKN